ncbi:MAG: SRPBCC family protein [Acidimicrobiia bacterium]|nr:SRPBCC family protein [Acidimicrobiia bacterium]
MKPLRATIVIDASAYTVWSLLSEFRHWPSWGPTVRAVQADTAVVEPGVSGRVQTSILVWLPFEIETVRVGEYWDWRVLGVFATGHGVERIDTSSTRVVFSTPWWFAPYLAVLHLGLRRLRTVAERSEHGTGQNDE